MIDMKGLNKAEVLAALYNASKPQGMGMLHFDPQPMTTEEAARFLEGDEPGRKYFDYLKGRVMKVDLTGDAFDERLYDRDNGNGAAAKAIQALAVR